MRVRFVTAHPLLALGDRCRPPSLARLQRATLPPMNPVELAQSSALLAMLLVVCGCDSPPPLEPRPPAPESAASVDPPLPSSPPPLALPARSKRAHIVSIGRISERFVTADPCEIDDDCVVVSRHQQAELCPPGTVTNRRGYESDESWAARGFAFRRPRAVCIDPGTTLRPLCSEHRCAGEAVPAGEADTQSETRIWAVHEELEACQREAAARSELGAGEAVFTVVVARDGNVAHVETQKSLPDALKICLHRVLIRLQFPQPEQVRQLRVPLELRAVAKERSP